MRFAKFCVGTLLTCMAPAAALAEPTLRDKQQAACFNDVQTLCGDLMPDVDQITACMTTKKAKVSAGCARYYVDGKPPT